VFGQSTTLLHAQHRSSVIRVVDISEYEPIDPSHPITCRTLFAIEYAHPMVLPQCGQHAEPRGSANGVPPLTSFCCVLFIIRVSFRAVAGLTCSSN
jgi:hypothetical protein